MEYKSTLTVLETLSNESNIHQRKIAAKTGLNLAKVNFVMRKLVEKGFVKLIRAKNCPHKRRYLYLLTPAGMAEKSRLTYHFLQRTLLKYQEAERKVVSCVDQMAAQGLRRLVLWGNTGITDLCLGLIDRLQNEVVVIGVVDQQRMHPISIDPSRLNASNVDAILICDPESADLPEGIPVWKIP